MYDAIELPTETQELRAVVQRIVDNHQMPLEERILRGEELTFEDYLPGKAAAKAAGLWGLALPEEFGGAGMSIFDQIAVAEIAARPLAQLRFDGNQPEALLRSTGKTKEFYSDPILNGEKRYCFAQTEPSGGGDPGGSIQTRAVRDGDGWVINGNKVFISGVDNADVVLVVAVTDNEKRKSGGISMFVVEKDNPGLKITRDIKVLGGMVIHELFFDDCRVPDYALVGSEGTGFRSAQQLLSTARMMVGATALGIAQRALEMMTDYAKQRQAFGGPLSEKQAIQGFLVDSWIEIHQARLAMYDAARRTDRGLDTRVEAGIVKVLGTEVVGRVLDRAIQVHGASGVALDNPLAHWYGLQRSARIYEGPTEVHKYHVLARRLLKD